MGQYRCIADNGIPPPASQIFNLEVHCEYKMNFNMQGFQWKLSRSHIYQHKRDCLCVCVRADCLLKAFEAYVLRVSYRFM